MKKPVRYYKVVEVQPEEFLQLLTEEIELLKTDMAIENNMTDEAFAYMVQMEVVSSCNMESEEYFEYRNEFNQLKLMKGVEV